MIGKCANNTPELFEVGSRVQYYTERNLIGTVTHLDQNLIDEGYTSTTCNVLWDGDTDPDTQWTNKLVLLTDEAEAMEQIRTFWERGVA